MAERSKGRVSLKCIRCGREYEPLMIYNCRCGGPLEVEIDIQDAKVSKQLLDARISSESFPYGSGVWRFRELVHPLVEDRHIVSRPEGNTALYVNEKISQYADLRNVIVKHEGENPTGSFKDRGMTVGISEACRQGARVLLCASTGNTSSSLAAYSAMAGLSCVTVIPEGKIAYGKLSQTIAYGAKVLQVKGDFDAAMRLVLQASQEVGAYVLNSVNPWRIEGQKTIIFELLQQLNWEPPDWIIFPAGNLGNTSAFGKALKELQELGFTKVAPRLAAVQAQGADPFYQTWRTRSRELLTVRQPETIATAIRIGNPVNWEKALESIRFSDGVVEHVSDQEIMDSKAVLDSCGIGCEPASASALAGARKLREAGRIDRGESVVCILTGNILKDPEATISYHTGTLENVIPRYRNAPVVIEPTMQALRQQLTG